MDGEKRWSWHCTIKWKLSSGKDIIDFHHHYTLTLQDKIFLLSQIELFLSLMKSPIEGRERCFNEMGREKESTTDDFFVAFLNDKFILRSDVGWMGRLQNIIFLCLFLSYSKIIILKYNIEDGYLRVWMFIYRYLVLNAIKNNQARYLNKRAEEQWQKRFSLTPGENVRAATNFCINGPAENE